MGIIDNKTSPSTVLLVELTIPFTRNIEAANNRKMQSYEFLTRSGIEYVGYKCHIFRIRKFLKKHQQTADLPCWDQDMANIGLDLVI